MFNNTFQPDFIRVDLCKFAKDMGATKKDFTALRQQQQDDDLDYFHYHKTNN